MHKIICIHSLTAHGVVGLKPFLALLGEAALPVPSLLLTGAGNMPGCRRFGYDFAAMLEGTLAAAVAQDESVVMFIGYLGDAAQVDAIAGTLDRYAAKVSAVVVDPVSGDDGRAYVGAELIAAWPRLLARADWAMPNLTEVELLTGRSGEAAVEEMRVQFPRLQMMVTGWPAGDDVATRLYGAEGATAKHVQRRIAGRFNGSGDLFAAAWMREIFFLGATPAEAMARAAGLVANAIRAAERTGSGNLSADVHW